MKADGDKFAPNHHKMFSSLSVSLSPSLCLCWPDLLKQKDTEIMSLLEEKVQLFRGMWEGLNTGEEVCRQGEPFFRSACGVEPPRGASVMKDALQEGKREKECLQCIRMFNYQAELEELNRDRETDGAVSQFPSANWMLPEHTSLFFIITTYTISLLPAHTHFTHCIILCLKCKL